MKRLVTLLTLLAFAAVPTFAQAKPTPSVSNYSEIPYLSHGVGVDEANFGGSASSSEYQYRLGATEIPYLSQGVGVDDASLGAAVVASKTVSPDDRALPRSGVGVDDATLGAAVVASKTVSPDDRALPRSIPEPTPIVVTKDGGWNIDFVNPGFAALALLLGLLAGVTAAAMWSRRGRLTPA
jgi:hypothetical protein